MDISIIIPSYNTSDLTRECVASIFRHTKGISFEIVLVDNNSTDDTIFSLEKLKNKNLKILKNNKNLGFSGANLVGEKYSDSDSEYVLYLNSDTILKSNVIGEMKEWMDKNKIVAAASCSLINKDGSIQPTGGYFPNLINVFSWMIIQDLPLVDKLIKPFHPLHSNSFFSKGEGFYKSPKNIDWVTGAFMMARRSVVKEVGSWDTNYFMYMEEVDLCYRIKKHGHEIWYLPKWNITHLGGGSSKILEFPILSEYRGIKRFFMKYYPKWQYPLLRIILKIGSLGRILIYGLIKGKEGAAVYAKAFIEA